MVCPVAGLEKYVKEAQSMGVDLSTGYLFRPLDHSSRYVLDAHVTTPVMHSRLKYYLKLLGIDEGETIHGIRGGCAVTMSVLGCGNTKDVMDHVGWFSEKSLDRYSRMGKMTKLGVSGNMMRQISTCPDRVTNIFKCFGDPNSLSNAF